MLNFLRNILVIFSLLFNNYSFGSSSSSYLVSNTAVKLLDFDKAKEGFGQLDQKLSESDLQNQLFTFINLNLLSEANSVADTILSTNKLNQEAWIVRLVNGVIEDNLSVFNSFQINEKNSEMKLLNYIFFTDNGDIKSKVRIAKSIFEVIQASMSENNDQIDYKYLLFYLSIATTIDPSFREAYFYSAQIYQFLENYAKAELYYKQIPNDHKLFIDSQRNIAINKGKLNSYEEGINLLKKLLDNNQNISLMIALADIYRMQKKYKEAINHYTKIIDLNSNYYEDYWKIYYLRGICFERLKNWKLAEKDFLYSLKIKPDSPEVLNYLAYGWLERDINLNEATEMLQKAYQANPNSYYIADSLAWAFYKKNELVKAVNLMEKVIEMAPGEAISLFHLGDIYFAMNRKREASFFWKQALDLAKPEDEITKKLIIKLNDFNAG